MARLKPDTTIHKTVGTNIRAVAPGTKMKAQASMASRCAPGGTMSIPSTSIARYSAGINAAAQRQR